MILVVGATGYLGGEIVRLLRGAGKSVRALVRSTADAGQVRRIEEMGASLVSGDLKDPPSLDRACTGVTTVVSTANAIQSRQSGDSIATVDRDGQCALVDAAARSGVKHFVFISFNQQPLEFALQDAKRAVETRLRGSGLTYTILQPTYFMEIWLSPALGFDPLAGKARMFGSGDQAVSWVSLGDVARVAAGCVDNAKAANKTFPLGGPESLTPREVLGLFEKLGAPKAEVEHVPEAALEAQFAAAADPLAQAFAALMLNLARGSIVDARPALEAIPIKLSTVRDFAARMIADHRQQGA